MELDFSNSLDGSFVVANKADRISGIFIGGHCQKREADQFRGFITSRSIELCAGTVSWLLAQAGDGISSTGDETGMAFAVSR